MNAYDREGDRSWVVDEEEMAVLKCECEQEKVYGVELVASHEKVLSIERAYIGRF